MYLAGADFLKWICGASRSIFSLAKMLRRASERRVLCKTCCRHAKVQIKSIQQERERERALEAENDAIMPGSLAGCRIVIFVGFVEDMQTIQVGKLTHLANYLSEHLTHLLLGHILRNEHLQVAASS